MVNVLSNEHHTILIKMIETYGLHVIMQNLYGDGEIGKAAKKSIGVQMTKVERKVAGRCEKMRYIEKVNEKYPEWNIGDGKGYRLNTLRKSFETGKKPQKTPLSGYMIFLNESRKKIKDDGFTGKNISKEAGHRWKELSEEHKLVYINIGRVDAGLEPKTLNGTIPEVQNIISKTKTNKKVSNKQVIKKSSNKKKKLKKSATSHNPKHKKKNLVGLFDSDNSESDSD